MFHKLTFPKIVRSYSMQFYFFEFTSKHLPPKHVNFTKQQNTFLAKIIEEIDDAKMLRTCLAVDQ